MSSVLLTGATGLVGRELLKSLRHRHNTSAIARKRSADCTPQVRWIEHDLTLRDLPGDMPPTVDTVVHLAQSLHFREFPDQAGDIFEVNVGSTARLLDWARRVGAQRFVYASSGGVYGHGDQGFREEDVIPPPGPLGFYLASKRAAELLVEGYESVLTVIILRFFFVYGAGQRDSMLMPRLVRAVRRGEPITLQGPEGIKINPIHVADAARAVEASLALEKSTRINVAGPDVVTLREIAETIGERLGRRPRFSFEASSEPRHLVGDITRMKALLHVPRISLRSGIDELAG